jgi:outer membrane protein assembly factor BamB
MKIATVSLVVLAASTTAFGADWPQWRGPENNGITRETGISLSAAAAPKILWRAKVGVGHSSFAVIGGRAYTVGWDAGRDTIHCFEAESGRTVWTHSYESPKFDKFHPGGPGATPTVHEGRVYWVSKSGRLICLDAQSGSVAWEKDLIAELGAESPTWAFSGSAVIEGANVIVDVGVVAAFDRTSGQVKWRSRKMAAGYSTPVFFDHSGRRLIAAFNGEGLAVLDASEGRVIAVHPWKTQYEVNAGAAIVPPGTDHIFISSGYGRGSALLRFDGSQFQTIWESKEMKNQMNPSILIDGFLYGFDGDQRRPDTRLACVELATGKARWGQKGLGAGALIASVPKDSAKDAMLIAMSETGELVIVAADPGAYKELARAQLFGGICWTAPVLAEGRIYARNDRGDVVCVDVR